MRPEIVLALPIFGRSSVLVAAGSLDTGLELVSLASGREGFRASLLKERSSPESKEGISKAMEGGSLESGFARE